LDVCAAPPLFLCIAMAFGRRPPPAPIGCGHIHWEDPGPPASELLCARPFAARDPPLLPLLNILSLYLSPATFWPLYQNSTALSLACFPLGATVWPRQNCTPSVFVFLLGPFLVLCDLIHSCFLFSIGTPPPWWTSEIFVFFLFM